MPGVAFDLPNGVDKPNPKTGFISRLTNIRKVRKIRLDQSSWTKKQTQAALLVSDSVRVVPKTGTLPQKRLLVKRERTVDDPPACGVTRSPSVSSQI